MVKKMKDDRDRMRLDIYPDQNELDREWGGQSRLRMEYGLEWADAKRDLSGAKAELEVTEAELSLAIRSSPEKYGVDKPTEASIKAALLAQAEYQIARKQVQDAQHEVDVLGVALEAIDDRKHTLENWVKLHLAGYFGDPKAPVGAKDQMEAVEDRATWRRSKDRPRRGE